MRKKNLAILVVTGAAILVGAGAIQANMPMGGNGYGGQDRPSFEELDKNKDGKITQEELAAFRDAKFAEIDNNGDGVISKAEMQARAEAQMGEYAGKRMEHMMTRMDANNDGMLSPDEMSGKFDMSRAFKRMDSNGDGAISQEEFAAMEQKRGPKHGGQQGQGQGMGQGMGQQQGQTMQISE